MDEEQLFDPIAKQHLVIYHEHWKGIRTSQIAREIHVFTDHFLSDVGIPADSVTAHFEFAQRGFIAWMDEKKAETLRYNPNVDYVEPVEKSSRTRFKNGIGAA